MEWKLFDGIMTRTNSKCTSCSCVKCLQTLSDSAESEMATHLAHWKEMDQRQVELFKLFKEKQDWESKFLALERKNIKMEAEVKYWKSVYEEKFHLSPK